VLHCVVSADEHFRLDAVFVAFPSGISERGASDVDVAVRVCSDDMKELAPAAIFAPNAQIAAARISMAGEQLNKQGGNLKEAVEEGPSDHTSPVTREESF